MEYTKATLMTIFSVSIVVANITAAKLSVIVVPIIGGVVIPAGFLAVGVAFLCSDLLSEIYGKCAARKTVNATVIALVVAYGLIYFSIVIPAAPIYLLGSEYIAVLGQSANIVIASIVTILISQNIDVSVFHYLSTVSDMRIVRNVGSTATSQLIDTVLFISLGFVILPVLLGGVATPLAIIPSLIGGQYVVKLIVALLDTPIFYIVSQFQKRQKI